MATPTCTVRWTKTADKLLETIPDRRIQRAIHTEAGQLDHDPEQQAIVLAGLRKAGDKRDVYALAKKLLKQGLLREQVVVRYGDLVGELTLTRLTVYSTGHGPTRKGKARSSASSLSGNASVRRRYSGSWHE